MMFQIKPNTTILCMFSGGIDSSGVLHELLTNIRYASNNLIIHHIHILNRENRAKAEAQATKSILNIYKELGHKKFLYTESIFNTTGFAPLNSNRFPFDMDVCAFVAGNICTARKDISYVAMGRTKTDLNSSGDSFMARMNRAQSIFKSVLMMEPGNPPEYIFPVVHLSKEDIWRALPDKVKANTWWCRTPIYEENLARPCMKCLTCQEVKKFVK